MDRYGSYDLNSRHSNRYFTEQKSLPRLLNNIRKWVKENEDITVFDVSIQNFYSEDYECLVWHATVLYLGGPDA